MNASWTEEPCRLKRTWTEEHCLCWEVDWDLLVFDQLHNKITSLPLSTSIPFPKNLLLLVWSSSSTASICIKRRRTSCNTTEHRYSYYLPSPVKHHILIFHRHPEIQSISGYTCATGVAEHPVAPGVSTGGEPQMSEMETLHAILISVFSWTHFSLKPVDIPSLFCCCNANLSAPLKRGRLEEEEKEGRNREDHST